ncbi:MAG: response regulator transcription factor [Candidatus Desulforudis sp.]|nr:response regulator transcription factor [Desulforudis sp.]
MSEIGVLIVDDHALIREGLRKVLSLERQINVVGEAATGEEAVDLIAAHPVDVVLLDINLPGMNGMETCRAIKRDHPDTEVIALTIHDQDEYLFEMIRSGVSGYLLKDINPELLVDTILRVAEGESFIPPALMAKVMAEFGRLTGAPRPQFEQLTQREVEVLRLVAAAKSNREIAQTLYISEKTVKNHLTNIFQKIEVNDRTQAALYAIRHKIAKV